MKLNSWIYLTVAWEQSTYSHSLDLILQFQFFPSSLRLCLGNSAEDLPPRQDWPTQTCQKSTQHLVWSTLSSKIETPLNRVSSLMLKIKHSERENKTKQQNPIYFLHMSEEFKLLKLTCRENFLDTTSPWVWGVKGLWCTHQKPEIAYNAACNLLPDALLSEDTQISSRSGLCWVNCFGISQPAPWGSLCSGLPPCLTAGEVQG